jgi:hypothetical protein
LPKKNLKIFMPGNSPSFEGMAAVQRKMGSPTANNRPVSVAVAPLSIPGTEVIVGISPHTRWRI